MTAPSSVPTGTFATLQVQTGYDSRTPENSAVPPIHQTAAYEFASLADAADVFALRKPGNLYSRSGSPTQLILEQRVAALEGARQPSPSHRARRP